MRYMPSVPLSRSVCSQVLAAVAGVLVVAPALCEVRTDLGTCPAHLANARSVSIRLQETVVELASPAGYTGRGSVFSLAFDGESLDSWQLGYWDSGVSLPTPQWSAQLVCAEDRGLIFVMETGSTEIIVRAFQVSFAELRSVRLPKLTGKEEVFRALGQQPTAIAAFADDDYRSRKDTPRAFEAMRSDHGAVLRFVFRDEGDHHYDLLFESRPQKFKKIPPERQDFSRVIEQEQRQKVACTGSRKEPASLTLVRRTYSSPKQDASPYVGALLALEREPGFTGQTNGITWASSRQLPRGTLAGWIADAGAVCDEPSQSVLVFELRRSDNSFYVAAHRVPVAAKILGTLPPLEATPWSWLTQFWAPNPERIFPEDASDVGASVRALRVSLRDGKALIELIHDPPESHRYDLIYDATKSQFEKVPVQQGEGK